MLGQKTQKQCRKLQCTRKYVDIKANFTFDVRGSMHHSIIHTEIANKMQQCIKIYYSMFI